MTTSSPYVSQILTVPEATTPETSLTSTGQTGKRPKALLVCAHRIWNVPPLVNVATQLAEAGYDVIVLGYQAEDHPTFEKTGRSQWIVRLKLKSRRLRVAALRQMTATLEFLWAARRLTKRLKPDVLITFNDPATLLLRGPALQSTRVSWLLEYPEFEHASFLNRKFFRWSARHWPKADVIVAPTNERLALHIGLEPRGLQRKTFVIHNSPDDTPPPTLSLSSRAQAAKDYLLKSREDGWITIIYSGAIGNRYAIDRLIKAVGLTKGMRLLLLGKRHPLSVAEVETALQDCQDPECVHWIDEIPYAELRPVLECADIGFAHYLGDCLNNRFSAPGKLYEYLRAGLVLLTDHECCIKDELTVHQCASCFPAPGSVEAIAAALQEIADKPEQLPQWKENAQRLFQEVFALPKQMQGLLQHLSSASKS